MNYYEMINQMVEDSNLTLKEIAFKCEDYGLKVNPSYISKLKSGKQPPASDEVNKAIAKACNYEEEIDNLLFESYKEKAPPLIKDFLNEVINFFRTTTLLQTESSLDEQSFNIGEYFLENMTDYEFITFSIESIRMLHDDLKNNHVEESLTLIMKDNSMEPKIPVGSLIRIKKKASFKNGDMVAVLYKNKTIIRKYIELKNSIVLIAEKEKEEIIEVKSANELDILGKVNNIIINV